MIRVTAGKIRSVPPDEWPDVLVAAALAAMVEVGLRLLPLPRLARIVGTRLATNGTQSPSVVIRPAASPRIWRQLRATRRVMRHWPYGDTCLRHALVLACLLRRLDPVLHLGVAEANGAIRAHAWIEIDGAIVDPMGAAGSYARLEPVRPADLA